jgi:hypothetical protein
MINSVIDIDVTKEEGRMLMAALATLTTESRKGETPGEVIEYLNKLKDKMYNNE